MVGSLVTVVVTKRTCLGEPCGALQQGKRDRDQLPDICGPVQRGYRLSSVVLKGKCLGFHPLLLQYVSFVDCVLLVLILSLLRYLVGSRVERGLTHLNLTPLPQPLICIGILACFRPGLCTRSKLH